MELTRKTFLHSVISSLILVLSVFVSSIHTTVKADANSLLNRTVLRRINPNADINDGITNWVQLTQITPSYIDLGNDTQLGYTFGSWFSHGVDVDDTVSPTMNSNFFIKKSFPTLDKYIQALYTSAPPNNITHDPTTSLDFALISPLNPVVNPLQSPMTSLLGDKLNKSPNLQFYQGSDSVGHQYIKCMGYTSLTNTFDESGPIEFEIKLGPSKNFDNNISQTLYLKNTSSQPVTFGVMNGEDTDLSDQDNVPIKSLGNNRGIYIENDFSDPKYSDPEDKEHYRLDTTPYRLNINLDTPNGPDRYLAHYARSWLPIAKSIVDPAYPIFTGTDFIDAKGQEATAHNAGDVLYGGTDGSDTSYSLLWPYQTLQPGKTDNYGVSIGMSDKGKAQPILQQTYKNTTRSDGTNQVGDKLHFKLSVSNEGFSSDWKISQLVNSFSIKNGLTIDPNSIKLTDSSGKQTSISADDSQIINDADGLQFQPSNSLDIMDSNETSIAFDATINYAASGQTITATGKAIGTDTSDNTVKNSEKSIKIPVDEFDCKASLTQKVKNMNQSDSSYQNIATYLPGDTLNFKLDYTINADVPMLAIYNVDASTIQAKIKKSTTDPGTDLTVMNSVLGQFFVIDPVSQSLSADSIVEITFSKTVSKTDTPLNSIASQVSVSATPTITNQKVSTESNKVTAYLMNTTYFTSVPDHIDFGSLNKNVTGIYDDSSTTGSLKVTHYSPSASSNYQVKVAYDSTNADQQLTSASGQKIVDADALQLKQSDGTYTPLIPGGVPLNATGFTKVGVMDLTSYIKNKWRLVVNNPQSGSYKGNIKWTIVSSLQ